MSNFNEVRARTKQIEVNPTLDGCKKLILSVMKLLDSSIDTEDLSLFELFTDDGRKLAANAGWFLSDSKVKDHKATYQIYQGNEINIDFKMFGVQNAGKRIISWSQALTPNFEDEPFYEDLRIGIDFIVPKSFDRVLVTLSNNYVVRILELHGELTATYEEIFAKWELISDYSNKRFVHTLLWESFDLHPINKKFYEGIAERFVSLRQFLSEKEILDDVHASQFANRLIGRLVFCWFLRKKDFIDVSFQYFASTNYSDDSDYYREKLEVLFFDVLNKPVAERTSPDFSTPYLNGGLFEERLDDLVNKKNLRFPKNYFDDFFAFLDSYNFTTDESTSQYQQVAIDPEMLGRIFENLLAEMSDDSGEQARKARGAFYTPREIVDHMCREALKKYLESSLPPDIHLEQRLAQLIDGSEREFQDQDHNWRRDWKPYKDKLMMALDDCRIIDPACGSGAFPMGMLQLLLRVYDRLDPALGKNSYKMKLQIISNNLFGVDIEPMAVEISRLRAWLSLVVDLEVSAKDVKPLPNLDFRFLCADSLTPLDESGALMFGEDPEMGEKLEAIRKKYFSTENLAKKKKYRIAYEAFISGAVSLFGESKRTIQLRSYHPFDASATASFFDPSQMFGCSDFHIVIGNPPYIDSQAMVKSMEAYRNELREHYDSAKGNFDLFVVFLERSMQLLHTNGVMSMIVKNQLIGANYATQIRRILSANTVDMILDYSEVNVFKSASVYPVIIQVTKNDKRHPVSIQIFSEGLDNPQVISIPTDKFYSEDVWGSFFASSQTQDFISLFPETKKLEDLTFVSEVASAGPTGEAYEFKEFIREFNQKTDTEGTYKRFINTGTVDPFISLWGIKKCRYLKDDYINPVVSKDDIISVNSKRLDVADLPKIIVGGMSKRIEAFLDVDGSYMPGISTFYISIDDLKNLSNLKYLAGLLNSDLLAFWFAGTFTGLKMAGGYLRISHKELRQIPVVVGNKKDFDELVELVDQLITRATSEDLRVDLTRKLNSLVLEIYGISEEIWADLSAKATA